MLKRNHGHIVSVASSASLFGNKIKKLKCKINIYHNDILIKDFAI
jgi:hypothetical protein